MHATEKTQQIPKQAGTPLIAGGQSKEIALLVGTGPKLGTALARKCAEAGMEVALAARNTSKLRSLVNELSAMAPKCSAYGCDASREQSVSRLFETVRRDFGTPTLVVYNVEHFIPGSLLDIQQSAFEDCWRAMCLGGFLVGKAAARAMLAVKRGTIVYTGATGSLRGREGYLNLAVGKFGVRALAQVMARELGPKGIHVAHVVIDGGIQLANDPNGDSPNNSSLVPDEIAKSILHIHGQHPSSWTQELDLRPWVEKF
jgi:NAD(P)-dependent dehydrogenase (short-subunit alcohol dehydrogenase family)